MSLTEAPVVRPTPPVGARARTRSNDSGLDIWLSLEAPNGGYVDAYSVFYRGVDWLNVECESESVYLTTRGGPGGALPSLARGFTESTDGLSQSEDALINGLEELLLMVNVDPLISLILAPEWASVIRGWIANLSPQALATPSTQSLREAKTLERRLNRAAADCTAA